MKAKLSIQALLFLLFCLQGVHSACTQPFTQVTNEGATYCVKCDTTCATCFDDNVASCVTCKTDFTFNDNTSYCIPPSTTALNTVESSFKWYGFGDNDWTAVGTMNCGYHTLLEGTGSTISKDFDMQPHYKMRLMLSIWRYSSTGNLAIAIKDPDGATFGTGAVAHGSFVSTSNLTRYCTGLSVFNYDEEFDGDQTDSITIEFSLSNGDTWGIREFVLIEYLCDLTWCKTCDGPTSDECFECADEHRIVYSAPATSGECECDQNQDYFRHPDIDFCVKPCPSRPSSGQYYGDRASHLCVLQCPLKTGTTYGMQFADDTTSICVDVCPATISLGTQTKDYYHDTVNRKCVTNCPAAQPYRYKITGGAENRTCLADCPDGTYANDATMNCEATCDKDDIVPLYMDDNLNACVAKCEGDDWWADYLTGKCTATCSSGQFEDNSTVWHKCTAVCPAPEYFGDVFSGKCIDHCYGGKFGDADPGSTSGAKRVCVPKCNGTYFGLLTGNRACVQTCPNGTWGEYTTRTCALVPTDCDSDKYADNYTHLCVAQGSCSGYMFSTDATQTCEYMCPEGEYADESDMHCKSGCTGSFFADPGINKCVQVCYTEDLYADVDSGNKCVEECNATGGTPYRQALSRTCVDVCPDNPYTFSDPDEGSCVYNCTIGRYKDDLSDPDDKRCVRNCVSPNWGDNSTGYGICRRRCPDNPPLFGDTVDGFRVCVEVCAEGSFGDQSPSGFRECIPICPLGWFAQDDELRRCVLRCNSTTYGTNKVCVLAEDCPTGEVGDPYTALCTNLCSQEDGLFADSIVTNLCVEHCPINNSILYFADPTDRWCRDTCTSPNLFGNNDTQTCEEKCIDFESFADFINPFRFCIADCLDSPTDIYYRNNETKTCVLADDCQDTFFADNYTHYCVAKCPYWNDSQSWAHPPTQTCVGKCYDNLWGDDSRGLPICIPLCPSLPMKWSYDPDMLCVERCPDDEGLFGEDFTRTCVTGCPADPDDSSLTYAYNGTRRCLKVCPEGTFGDDDLKVCHYHPQNCSDIGWADDYNNLCTSLCTATPWDTYGDNETHLCTTRCSEGSYADNFRGTRICVEVCPGSYDSDGVLDVGSHDTFGDNSTQSCVESCKTPETWADWQTHRCEDRCTGDNQTTVPTYSENQNYRCVIAKWCPELPDKLFGDNNTRSCVHTCQFNDSYVEWADNLTRSCIPRCLNFASDTLTVTIPFEDLDTRFFGDLSTGSPICVVICPSAPRLFGENSTNKCVEECPDNQYGDQTGNRTCVPFCPLIAGVIWYTQLTDQLCVTVCEEGTWGNKHDVPRPACETVPTDCIIGEYADNSTNLCVPLCPEDQNYFGDPSTRLCVDRCPTLDADVTNTTASINMIAGILFADYWTRLCVYKCPEEYGPHGTFGDNFTNTCVYRCPTGSYGDWQHPYRHCVTDCTAGTFADDLSMTCVSECPASPPYFGERTGWTCVKHCPEGTWANAQTRTCDEDCPDGQFRLSDERDECVDVCPSDPDLYGDPDNDNCVYDCNGSSSKPYADPLSRTCKDSCLPLFQYENRCVKYCPRGYYANALGDCVIPTLCDTDTYGDNRTTQCTGTCVAGSYADPNSRYCIAVCPNGWYGDAGKCVENCTTASTSASTINQLCVSNCPNYTYHENDTCKSQCEYGYANDVTGLCDTSCSTDHYADPLTHDCVTSCQDHQSNNSLDYFRNLDTGFCVDDCEPKFKDFITGNCVDKCSPGYWGNTGNFTCIEKCIDGEYGLEDSTQRTCYAPTHSTIAALTLFGDPVSGMYISVCPIAPIVYFGDRILHECVDVCGDHSATDYYGDPSTRECESVCQNDTFYTADPSTHRCVIRCPSNTYRFNDTPICEDICPDGYADDTTNVCVEVCPTWADTFGYANPASPFQRVCMQVCPDDYFAEPVDRTCSLTCADPLFAYNGTHECVNHCLDSFADKHNWKCMDICYSNDYPFADNSTNQCVDVCPEEPDYYGDDHVCVFYCTTPNYYADPDTRECVPRCPNISGSYNSYGDPLTGRCVETCSLGYYADNFTNLCVKVCPSGSFGYNETRQCIGKCIVEEDLYGDPFTHLCAYTCSSHPTTGHQYYGSQVTQECITQCQLTYWGDPLTTLCVQTCPVKLYSFGQNDSRTCVTSCVGYSGFADNTSRLCRDVCQDTITPQTFADPTTKACVQICPDGYFMQNSSDSYPNPNECVQQCTAGYADNFSRYCVNVCPDDPESFGDDTYDICVYDCLFGEFADNTTNMCVVRCPGGDDAYFYGDPHIGRCVHWCTEGSWAHNDSRQCIEDCPLGQYEDNLTRRCVTDCPPTENTFADDLSHACVRVCPENYYADNSTQKCVSDCPDITLANGTVQNTYEDNITEYCVALCPEPHFGRNDTNECVEECPAGGLNLFGHFKGHVCVTVSNCYEVDGIVYLSDPTTRTCVQKCPLTLWADFATKKCVPNCPPTFYRNWHDQTCVSNCPEDPDEYIDYTSDNCVRKCPEGWYAVVDAGDSLRKCVQQCLSHGLIKDSVTRRCVDRFECPTEPYMFGDYPAGACVHLGQCSSTVRFADNKTQTCVPTCPADWQYFGSLNTWQCVSQCDNYQFADVNTNRQCVTITCASDWFKDNETSKCVEHCSEIKPYYYEDVPSGSCVEVCPGESYAYNPTQTCIYTQNGISQCPGNYFADRISKSCVLLCPIGTFATTTTKYCEEKCTGIYFAENDTRTCMAGCPDHFFAYDDDPTDQKCLQFCPFPYYAQNSSKSCELGCSSLLALPSTRSCESYCPEPYFADLVGHQCLLTCEPISKFADIESRTCVAECTLPLYSNPINYTCDLLCPEGYFGRNGTKSCERTCLNDTFADPFIRICVSDCPIYPMLFADDRTNQCLPECEAPLFAYTEDRTCRDSCPNVSDLIYLADSSNRRCVLECTNQLISFADYENNECTQLCPNGTFASNYTKECVPRCDSVPNDTFADPVSHICLSMCPLGYFGDPDSLTCELSCTLPKFGEPLNRTCVDFCPDGYFAENTTKKCVPICSPGTYGDPSTNRCVDQCPAVENLFKYDEDWLCVDVCPGSYYANENISKCVLICDSMPDMYAYNLTNQCLLECPVPYRGYDVDHTCILNCPSDYFYNITRNKCTQCPVQCLTCTGPTSCMTCAIGYNLFNGQCSYSCIPQNGVITYAHPTTNMCVQSCPSTYFGNNATYTCTLGCPIKQYGSTETGLCQHCPDTCSACSSYTHCTACESEATLAIDNMCYSDCNTTHRYYYANTCYSTCPGGTYISFTNVNCEECSSLCGTCTGTASTCTSCHDRYYYENTCITQCPSGFYGATDLTCQSCSSSSSNICSDPLTFSTEVSLENYQYVIRMKFNHQVSIERQISDILKINLKVSRRRFLDLATLINNGVPYTYQILSDGTIKLYLQLDTDLQSPTFNVQITDPTAITSLLNGGTLQDTDSSLSIDEVEYYPPEDGSEIGIRKAALFCVVFVLLLYLITFLFSDTMVRVLQMLQLLFFHCIVSAPIPAGMFFFLKELKLSLLQFLPNWLAIPIPFDVNQYPQTTNQKTIDVFIDYNFFRNVGQIVLPTIILFVLFVIFMILSNRNVVEEKTWQKMFQIISIRRFRFSVLNDIFGIFYLPILIFGFYQFETLFGSGYAGFNGFICLLCVIFCLIMPFLWGAVWWKKERQEVEERFPFMTNRINELNERAHLETSITYIYLLFCAIWLVALYNNPMSQMVLLIITNIFYILYMFIGRPYSIHVNSIMMVIFCVTLIVVESFTIYFTKNDEWLISSEKTKIAYPLLITVSVVLMVVIIWSVWRAIWQFMDVWKFFSETQFYKLYGDPNVEEEKEESEEYNKYEKIAVNNEPTVGDVLIDKIVKQCNDKGENVIKVKKKVLKKKKKARGRGKIQVEEEQEQQKEFVRVNQINPFDYDYDEDFKPKQQQKDPMKRTFDDDLRDIVSDEEEKSREKVSPKKRVKEEEIQLKIEQKEKKVENVDHIIDDDDPFDYIEDEEDEMGKSQNNFAPRKTFMDEKKKPEEEFDDYYKDESMKESENQSPKEENKSPVYSPRIIPEKKEEARQEEVGQEDQDEYESVNFDQLLDEIPKQEEDKGKQEFIEQKANKSDSSEEKNEKKEVVKAKGIDELLEEEENNKKKKLMFLFDDFEEDD